MESRSSRDAVRDGLLWIADDFTRIVDGLDPAELGSPTRGTRWTNRQLLFHLVLGQKITGASIPLIGTFARMPPGVSRSWSRLLEACSRPYNWINWAGSAAAGQLLTPAMMRGMMDRTTRAILSWYDRAEDEALTRGMSMPRSWDPYFEPWMSRRDVLEWAPKHYRHHRAQLTLTTLPL
ncbi:DinB family protein [Sinomonas sp. P10A9]|uniref:DinB family protein n=1 Tax=Sinomonas puerhi TaxID=3238584 RepID=A0AB39L3P8_9MICC